MPRKKIDPLEAAILALPPSPKKAIRWTIQEDAMILKYAEEKGLSAIARVIKKSEMSVRRHFQELKERIK